MFIQKLRQRTKADIYETEEARDKGCEPHLLLLFKPVYVFKIKNEDIINVNISEAGME